MNPHRLLQTLRSQPGLCLCWFATLVCVSAQPVPAPEQPSTLQPSNQTATRAASANESPAGIVGAGAEDEPIVLSPFVVDSSAERGYYAPNTLAGTRVNTKLEDLGASITVVTKQQMDDFALLDINDVFLYEANTEGIGNFTDYSIDRNGNVSENVSTDPNRANRVRGISTPNRARNNFRTSGRVPLDPINTDSIEISRGPNSSIFGLGSPSGTVNTIATTGNVSRDFTTTQFRADSLGGTRASIDVNRVLIQDKLAFRASAVYDNEEFEREPSFDRTTRYNAMVQYRPFKYTALRASWERYDNKARRPNAVLPRDGVTHWIEMGRPTWDPSTWTVTREGVQTVVPYNSNQGRETTAFGPGLNSPGSTVYARGNLFIDDGVELWMMGRGATADDPTVQTGTINRRFGQSAELARTTFGPLAQTSLSLTNRAIYDWKNINIAAPNWGEDRVDTTMVELEQIFLKTPRHTLAAQAGWMREDAQRYRRTNLGQGADAFVRIDVNEKLLDGTPNPYFMRPYIGANEPTAFRQPLRNDSYRAQLAYQLTLSREAGWKRWIGDHSISGYYEYNDTVQANYRFRDVLTSDLPWIPAGTNRANGPAALRGYYRYYLGDATGYNVEHAPMAWDNPWGDYNFQFLNTATGQLASQNATVGEAYYNAANPQRTRNVIKTRGIIMQNRLLDDRLVTTLGWRKDANVNREAADTALNSDGVTMNPASDDVWPEPWFTNRGDTMTRQFVVRPLTNLGFIDRASQRGGFTGFLAQTASRMSLFYSKSDTFTPAPIEQNLLAELLPDPNGEGEEYGVNLNLWEGKLVVRYTNFETKQNNSRTGDAGIIATRAGRIDFAFAGNNDSFNLTRVLTENIRNEPQFANATEAQIATEILSRMEVDADTLARMNAWPVRETSDVTATGQELELNYNPTPNFTLKLTVAELEAVEENVSPNIQRYIDARMPVWQNITITTSDGQQLDWWTNRWGGGGVPRDFFTANVEAPYKLLRANEGKSRTQIRQWRANVTSSLRLRAFTDHRWFSNVALIGAVRWQDKASIGYYAFDNDPSAFDPDRPIYDSADTFVDLGANYTTKIMNDRIGLRLQLNVRNAFEEGGLKPIGALPNGVIHSYTIVDPRLIILTATFEF